MEDKELVILFLRVTLCHQKGTEELKVQAESTLEIFVVRDDFPRLMFYILNNIEKTGYKDRESI